jgi:flagellar hook assembly protein FlgD
VTFTVPEPSDVTVRLFDAQGREVAVLLENSRQQGTVTLEWTGRDRLGREAPSGVYYFRVEVGGFAQTRSLVLAR